MRVAWIVGACLLLSACPGGDTDSESGASPTGSTTGPGSSSTETDPSHTSSPTTTGMADTTTGGHDTTGGTTTTSTTTGPLPGCGEEDLDPCQRIVLPPDATVSGHRGWSSVADGVRTVFASDPAVECGNEMPQSCNGNGCDDHELVRITMPDTVVDPGVYAVGPDVDEIYCSWYGSSCPAGSEGGGGEDYPDTVEIIAVTEGCVALIDPCYGVDVILAPTCP